MSLKPLILEPKNGKRRKEAVVRRHACEAAMTELASLGMAIFRIDQCREWLVAQQTDIAKQLREAGVPMMGNLPLEKEPPR
jgi:hypothetical protein